MMRRTASWAPRSSWRLFHFHLPILTFLKKYQTVLLQGSRLHLSMLARISIRHFSQIFKYIMLGMWFSWTQQTVVWAWYWSTHSHLLLSRNIALFHIDWNIFSVYSSHSRCAFIWHEIRSYEHFGTLCSRGKVLIGQNLIEINAVR